MGVLEKMISKLQDTPSVPEDMKARVIEKLRTIYDPEIPLNIYDLGLIYELNVTAEGAVHIRMTLTAPNCPVAGTFPDIVQNAIWMVEGVNDVEVELVWKPQWSKELMSEAAKLQLGLL